MSSWPSAKARRVFAALKRIGWRHDRTVGSHKIMKKDGWADTHSRFTIPRNSAQPFLRKSQERPVFNPKICYGAGPREPQWRHRPRIIADTPGHEQYTRNMATGASTANLVIILIDAR